MRSKLGTKTPECYSNIFQELCYSSCGVNDAKVNATQVKIMPYLLLGGFSLCWSWGDVVRLLALQSYWPKKKQKEPHQ